MFWSVVGHSTDLDSASSVKEILAQCDKQPGNEAPRAGIIYLSPQLNHQIFLDAIMKKYPGLELIGCSSDGEFSSTCGFAEESATLTLFGSDAVEIAAGVGRNISSNPAGSVQSAVNNAKAGLNGKDAVFGIAFPDSLTSSPLEVLDNLKKSLGADFPVFGGAAADRVEFSKNYKTYQFYKNEVLTDAVPLLLFGGPLHFSFGVASGWKPIGKKMKITRMENRTLFELDGVPPVERYKKYTGDPKGNFRMELSIFSLAVYENESSEHYYIRTPFDFDEENGSMKFFTEIPPDSTIGLTHATRDDIISGARESFEKAANGFGETAPEFVFCFSCAGRKLMLGTKTKEEYGILGNKKAWKDVPVSGFYTFGEISPLHAGGETQYHNTTFVTLMVGSK